MDLATDPGKTMTSLAQIIEAARTANTTLRTAQADAIASGAGVESLNGPGPLADLAAARTAAVRALVAEWNRIQDADELDEAEEKAAMDALREVSPDTASRLFGFRYFDDRASGRVL